MNIEELMTADTSVIVDNSDAILAALEAQGQEQEVEQDVRRQLKENIDGQETTAETMQMLEQKYGLAPVKFTRIEEKVIRKQARREQRFKEGDDAAA